MIELKSKEQIVLTFNNIEKSFVKIKRKMYSNDILCFDIETTSLFYIDGEFKTFDYSKPKEFYKGIEKRALPYIWQFSFNDKTYYCRDFMMFGILLKAISDENIKQYIYIHNLAFEFHWLLNIIKKFNWHIENILARGVRKVIQFEVKELNIVFRCSYALTNLSLEKSGLQFNTEHSKLVGNLDYNVARSPLTKLSTKELEYCENDIIVMYEFLQIYREEYGSIKNIPITQTGEVRKDINKHVDYGYHKKVWQNIPDSTIYQMLMCAFMGGVTHANMKHSGKVLNNVASFDYSSSYPFRLVTCKFPSTKFFRIDTDEIEYFKEKCCILYHIKIKNFKSKLYNNYIPSSKCIVKKGCRYDNGRIIKGAEIEIYLTDVDLEIIQSSYQIEEIEYIDIYASYKNYLPKVIIELILDYFEKKTKLKGNADFEYLYMKSKQKINSMFGCAVTNPLKQNYDFDIENDEHNWKSGELTEEFIDKKIEDMKQSFSVLFTYGVGVWCTAYARQGLWNLVSQIDRDSIYFDTDSDKILNYEKYKNIIDKINKENYNVIKEISETYEIPLEKFSPTDIKGNKHTIGLLEFEGIYQEFVTLGAKKYCYRENDKLKMTLSGVRKSAVSQLNNDIRNFKKGFEFDYDINKLNMIYDENQQPFNFIDIDGNEYYCDDIKWCIIAQPTTYTLGITSEYENLLEFLENGNTYF